MSKLLSLVVALLFFSQQIFAGGTPTINVIENVDSVSCYGGSNGAISLSVTGGGPLYNFSWSNGTTTQNITGLAAGNYCYTVTDANTSVSNCINVYEPDELSYQLYYLKNVSCYGANDGEVGEYASGGTPPYTYACSGGSLNNLASGFYEITVTDSKNCVSNPYPFAITEPDPLEFIAYMFSNVTCYGNNDGAAVSYTAEGGTPPYTYNWSGGSDNNLAPGYYEVTVVDSMGCSSTPYPFGITEPDSIIFELLTYNVTCHGLNDGFARVFSIGGGNGNYTYIYSAVSGFITLDNGMGEIGEVHPGEYTLVVVDDKGCSSDTTTFFITEPDSLLITSPVITPASSQSATDGSVEITITGGTSPYSTAWSNNIFSTLNDDLAPGNYCVTISDNNNCVDSACYTVNFVVGIDASSENLIDVFASSNEIVISGLQNKHLNAAVAVYSVSGRLMTEHKTIQENNFSVNTHQWSSGIYLVQVRSNESVITKRILVR